MPDCSICIQPILKGEEILKCGHTFQFDCVKRWLGSNKTCPLCRAHVVDNSDKSDGEFVFDINEPIYFKNQYGEYLKKIVNGV